MERLRIDPNNVINSVSPRICQARVSEVCKGGSGLIEPERAKTARYCALCAPIVRRRQSAAYKKGLRMKLGWRGYRTAYLSTTEEEERANHRARVRRWRARRIGPRLLRRSLTPAN